MSGTLCWTSADKLAGHTDKSHSKALKNWRGVDTRKKGKTPFVLPEDRPRWYHAGRKKLGEKCSLTPSNQTGRGGT